MLTWSILLLIIIQTFLLFDFQEITAFLEEINKIANLSERLQKWHICIVICVNVFRVWQFVLRSLKFTAQLLVPLEGSTDAQMKTMKQIARDTFVMIARCGLSLVGTSYNLPYVNTNI